MTVVREIPPSRKLRLGFVIIAVKKLFLDVIYIVSSVGHATTMSDVRSIEPVACILQSSKPPLLQFCLEIR